MVSAAVAPAEPTVVNPVFGAWPAALASATTQPGWIGASRAVPLSVVRALRSAIVPSAPTLTSASLIGCLASSITVTTTAAASARRITIGSLCAVSL
jgi:hypothetical protein